MSTIKTAVITPQPVTSNAPNVAVVASAPAVTQQAAEAATPMVEIEPLTAAAERPVEPLAIAAVDEDDEAKLRVKPYRRIGAPYQIAGSWYEPKDDPNYDSTGQASWYGAAFHGRTTANGEVFDSGLISAAHPTLPLPSYVKVTNLENDRSIMVRVNDRGPFRHKRLIDVSERTAQLLGFHHEGMTQVRVQFVSKAPLREEPQSVLLASYSGPPVDQKGGANVMVASAKPDTSGAVAFADEQARSDPSNVAMASLTQSRSAGERILMAFDVAGLFQ